MKKSLLTIISFISVIVLTFVLTACNTVPDKKLISQIDYYCKRNGFDYYISDSIELVG